MNTATPPDRDAQPERADVPTADTAAASRPAHEAVEPAARAAPPELPAAPAAGDAPVDGAPAPASGAARGERRLRGPHGRRRR
ncbi:MAG TPA: 23S rRNA pseudouridylate synthase B, partial [Burkholderiaceae bacterium]|nr:23S rRNA pseudouridylate synthase B [Burkholderiaceae bacterium]